MERSKIILKHEYPPIPQRTCDWRAYREGDEEIPARHGWGGVGGIGCVGRMWGPRYRGAPMGPAKMAGT
jgi:hypothetical protein